MKKFALPDTLADPYFTIDAGGKVTVKVAPLAHERMQIEIWRDGKILCRVFAESVQIVQQPADDPGTSTQEELFRGYRQGGEKHLKKMLEQMPEENDEDAE